MKPRLKETTLSINLKNLDDNVNIIKSLHLSKNKTIIAVLKSDAYGHGITRVAERLIDNGINFFGIIKLREAEKILKKNSGVKLLLLAGIPENDIDYALESGISIGVFNLDLLRNILEKAKKLKKTAKIHLKYDTGMGRLGFDDKDFTAAIDLALNNINLLHVEGIFSHLSSAGNDIEYTNYQLSRFKKILTICKKKGLEPEYRHISASSALFNESIKNDFSNAVRPGISLYGINPNIENAMEGYRKSEPKKSVLKPLMSLNSSILQIKKLRKGEFISYNKTFMAPKDMTVAVIGAGYDNGIPRLLSNNGRVIIKGYYANIVGIITMNLMMADITGTKGISGKDYVTIIGNNGKKSIDIGEISGKAGTIPYEICLNIGKSNRRLYKR